MPDTLSSVERINTAARRARVVELRRTRVSFVEIGRELGISGPRAWKIYQDALKQVPAAQLEEHRTEELALIDDAIRDLLPIARDHSRPRSAVEAWNCIARWADRKSRLLGLDAPSRTRLEVIPQEVVDAEIERLRLSIAAHEAENATRAQSAVAPGSTVRAEILPAPADWEGPEGDDDAA